MKLAEYRTKITTYNQAHPTLPNCIYPNCPNKILPQWDNQVLCAEHNLLVEFWFYEKDGYQYCPDIWSIDMGKKIPKPEGSDTNMTAYRKRYCDWIAALSPAEYESILKSQIGDERDAIIWYCPCCGRFWNTANYNCEAEDADAKLCPECEGCEKQ